MSGRNIPFLLKQKSIYNSGNRPFKVKEEVRERNNDEIDPSFEETPDNDFRPFKRPRISDSKTQNDEDDKALFKAEKKRNPGKEKVIKDVPESKYEC